MEHECPRCAGKGIIAAYKNVLGGVCFKCGGSGKTAKKPTKMASSWVCEYRGAALFTIKARTEGEAYKKAVAKIDPRYPAFAGVTSNDVRVYPAHSPTVGN